MCSTRAIPIPAEAAGRRLDRFLGELLGSRSKAQRLLAGGHVLLDGATAAKSHLLRGTERLVLELEADPTPPHDEQPAPHEIRLEDEWLLVVDKPAGVVVHPARGHRAGTLAQALTARGAAGGESWRAGIVHRLDRGTSGLLVVAKDDECHRRLKAALARREIVREYLTLVEGRPPARSGTIDAPLGRDRRVHTRTSIDSAKAREARTHFELERALAAATLLRVRLETGRTHQIRAHFQAIGHPVCGDPEYGHAGLYGLERQFLHATRLRFEHPFGDAPVDVHSPLPADLRSALDAAAAARAR